MGEGQLRAVELVLIETVCGLDSRICGLMCGFVGVYGGGYEVFDR